MSSLEYNLNTEKLSLWFPTGFPSQLPLLILVTMFLFVKFVHCATKPEIFQKCVHNLLYLSYIYSSKMLVPVYYTNKFLFVILFSVVNLIIWLEYLRQSSHLKVLCLSDSLCLLLNPAVDVLEQTDFWINSTLCSIITLLQYYHGLLPIYF